MRSRSLPIPAEERQSPGERTAIRAAGFDVLVAGFADPAAADYAAYTCRRGDGQVAIVADAEVRRRVEAPVRAYSFDDLAGGEMAAATDGGAVASLILFLNSRLTRRDRRALDDLLRRARAWQTDLVGVVSSFRAHLGDQGAAEAEAFVLARLKGLRARIV